MLINKSEQATDFQRSLVVKEDDLLIEKIKLENKKNNIINQKTLDGFRNTTNIFQQNFFKTYPLMQEYVKN